MGVESKLVTLADLKAAYDDLKRRTNMWEDITDQLTFSAATWQPKPFSENDSNTINWYKVTNDVRGSAAQIQVTPGERYRLTAWSAGDTSYASKPTLRFVAAILNSSNGLLSAYCPETTNQEMHGSGGSYYCWKFAPVEITIPKNAMTLVVFSFGAVRGMGSSVDDVILEKLVQ